MSGRPLLAGAAVLAAVLCATGCSAPAGSPAGPSAPDAVVAPMPSADEFVSAIVATRSMGTADVVVDVTEESASGTVRLQARGPAVLPRGRADLTWTGQGTFRELVNDQAIFTQRQPPDGPWIRTTYPGTTATSGYADTLRGLSVLRDVTAEGSESLGGVKTSRYAGWLPATQPELQALGLSADEANQAVDSHPNGRVAVTVWLDSRSHIVQVARDFVPSAPGDPQVRAVTTLQDFSVLLNLNSPRDNVQDASSD